MRFWTEKRGEYGFNDVGGVEAIKGEEGLGCQRGAERGGAGGDGEEERVVRVEEGVLYHQEECQYGVSPVLEKERQGGVAQRTLSSISKSATSSRRAEGS